MRFTGKTANWYIAVLLALVVIFIVSGCEPVDETEVEPTVTLTGLDVGVETTIEVPPTPGEPAEVGIDLTAPAQDPLLPVTATPTMVVDGEPVTGLTPGAPIETPPAFVEAMREEARTAVRFSDLLNHPVITGTGDTVAEIAGILADPESALPHILLDVRPLTGASGQIVAVEANLFEATLDGADSFVFYLGSIPYLQSLPALDTAQWPEDSLVVSANDVELITTSEHLLWIRDLDMLLHLHLVDAEGEDLGEVQDLIIDLTQGRLMYVVVDIGGFLGLTTNTVAIPWDRLQLDVAAERLVSDVDRETLTDAPTVDLDGWEAPTDDEWDAEIRDYWQGQ